MEDNKIIITDENGNEVEMEIIFTFEFNSKNFVVYFDPSGGDECEAYASIYDDDGNLFPIESDEEWDKVQEMFENFEPAEEESVQN